MKLAKRFIALAVVAVMLVSTCIFASAAMLSRSAGHNITSDGAVVYTKYSATGVHTEDVTVLEFNPDDGYLALPFIGTPNSTQLLNEQYTVATQKYGYEVVGMVNAGFFDMTALNLEGIVITDGRIIAGQRYAAAKDMVAFGSDGSIDFVSSLLRYDAVIGGEVLADSIFSINLNDRATDHNTNNPGTYNLGNTNKYIYYYDSADPSEAYYSAGCQIICEKLDYTEISVGNTLRGRVVAVNTNTKGGNKLADNQFALYAKNGSTYASKLSAVKVGDEVGVRVTETVAESAEIMSDAFGVFSNLGVFVKDGVDLTESGETIGRHPMTTLARWTMVGIKADGTYVFLTSEGGYTNQKERSLYLSDAAKAMIELGCETVFRLDGGGSTGMYASNAGNGNAGYVTTSTRAIADSLLIVKKSSLGDSALESELSKVISAAKSAAGSNVELRRYIAGFEELIGAGATEGELREALANFSEKEMLGKLLAQCENANSDNFSESDLADIRTAYQTAKSVYNSASATDAQYNEQTQALSSLLNKAVEKVLYVESYTRPAPNYYVWDPETQSDTDQINERYADDYKRLTDGVKSTPDGNNPAYSAWTSDVEIVLNLGTVGASNMYRAYFASGQWGIYIPSAVTVSSSVDGKSWTAVDGELAVNTISDTDGWDTHEYVITSDSLVKAQYIKFNITKNGPFVWTDEVEVILDHSHTYANEWSKDADSHWHECECGDKSDAEAHAESDWTLTDASAKIESKLCVNCGYVIATRSVGGETPDPEPNPEPPVGDEYILGDVNASGAIDMMDYILLKRNYFGTFDFDADQLKRGDCNRSGAIDMMDYILLKRAYFGTFELK